MDNWNAEKGPELLRESRNKAGFAIAERERND
jgi:hypothetical protein